MKLSKTVIEAKKRNVLYFTLYLWVLSLSCTQDEVTIPQPEKIIVTFNTQGGSTVSEQTIYKGGKQITKPNNPTKDNNLFKGWLTEETGGTKITFPYAATENQTLYAHWQPETKEALKDEIERVLATIGQNVNLNYIDTSLITDMSDLFLTKHSFNGIISEWNVFAVTNMKNMFGGASSFNGNISYWNVSAVTNMSYMFSGATNFNQDINSWNVSAVTNMIYMFKDSGLVSNPPNWYLK